MIWIILSVSAILALCGASFIRGGQGAVIDRPGQEPKFMRGFRHTAFRDSHITL